MNVTRVETAFADARGSIVDVMQDGDFQHATLIDSVAGAVRGNHYHRETWQWLYVVSGAIRYVVGLPDGTQQEGVLHRGDLLLTEPNESHALETLEETLFLVLTRGPRGGDRYESDTFRLDVPLIPPRA